MGWLPGQVLHFPVSYMACGQFELLAQLSQYPVFSQSCQGNLGF